MLAREQGAACGPDFPGLRALRGCLVWKPRESQANRSGWLPLTRCGSGVPATSAGRSSVGWRSSRCHPAPGSHPAAGPCPPRSDSRPSEAARARTAPRRGLGRAAAYTWNNGVGLVNRLVPASTAGVPEGTGQRSQGRQRRHRPGARAEAARSKPGRRNPLSLLRPRWGPERDVSRGA